MKRLLYFFLLALTPVLASAFGLGNLDLNSALNEPFDARIQLLSPTADELDSLKISLADSEAFARAKIDRPFILSKLRFDLRRSVDDGPDYIRVYSSEPIREPFLNFLVEVSWSNGRLFREYTVLLDPPLYDPNARSAEFAQAVESSSPTTEVTKMDDPDHQVTYGEAYENFTRSEPTPSVSPSYTPQVDYSGGDYGPTTGADTLWSIASEMRPDSSISVNKMMMALLRANPDAFINQNINGLKRGQILRMPNESEINSLSNAEALKEAQSQYSAWGDIRENLSGNVSERPEVSSTTEVEAVVEPEKVVEVATEETPDAELKLISADDSGEATEQVSSVDSGTGEELILAQETIQVLTQENIELKDRVQESEALLDDLKRLLQLKDDELAALQEQMAMAEPEEEVAEAEEEVQEEVAEVEEEILPEAEEEVAEVEEEVMTEAEEEATDAEEDVIEVIETEPEPASGGVMAMVDEYLKPVKDILLGNPMIGMAVAGVLVLLIIIVVIMKFRKPKAETVHIDTMTEEAFPDFDSGDMGSTGEDVPDSEAATVLPDSGSEAETELPEDGGADFDLDLDEEEEKTQFVAAEETPVEEEPEEEEEDPLQEVNTYLAFEQFDQAEEFVRNVINDSPDNPEYHTKLLEVFYTSGNKKSYEEEAKVLHDLVGGEGEHWNMATAMWSEMSPNRALFEAGEDDDDDAADNTGGGFVDVTADEEAGEDDAGGLDFDIGGAEEAPAAAEPAADEGMLDITGSSDEEILDATVSTEAEDLLDVTAAVNIDDEINSEEETAQATDADDILDISGTGAGAENLLDVTSAEESSGDDLLDVTAATDLDLDSEEDLLDVTAATGAGADSSELLDLDDSEGELDIDIESSVDSEATDDSNEIEFDVPVDDNATVEFDIDTASEQESTEDSADDNALDFDIGLDDNDSNEVEDTGNEIELDIGAVDTEAETNEIELDISEESASEAEAPSLEIDLDDAEEDEPIRLDIDESNDDMSLDIDMGDSAAEEDMSLEIDLGDDASEEVTLDTGEDEGIELDLSIGDDEPEVEASSAEADAPEIDFDFSLDDEPAAEPEEPSLDLDGTVELPKSALSVEPDEDDDDDDDDHTVFVPRAAQPEEQSAEDEIATKLDLAKAYVELGDSDSAKTILDEVMAEGNEEQRKQAEDLLGQV